MNVSQSFKQPKLAVIAAIVAAAFAGVSAAQQQEPTRQNANRPQTGQSTQVARSDAGLQTVEQFLQSKTLRVSKLVGLDLQTRSGDSLGEVKDIIPSAAAGRGMQLIVSTGGVGADQKLIAVPFNEVQINADGDELYTNRTKEQLASAPAVTLDARTSDTAAAANRSAAPQPGAGADTRTPPPAGAAAGRGATSTQQPVADLVGADVYGSGDDKVGEVDDIVISTAGADSIRAVLQVGGVAGIGEKRISLPLSQLAVERSGNDEPKLRVALEREALDRMPEFKYEEQTSAL
ncbi:MAG TPA: PRC-barrel domain-containing protein [Gammaproteobacteria bacterium]|nr:PRC-barrel domain-containing protein [Gammaproteobacteria bacterium]